MQLNLRFYEGSISDKQIVERSGFLDILRKKLTVSEIKKGFLKWLTKVLISRMN